MNVLVYSNPVYSIEDDYYFLNFFKEYDNSEHIINFFYENHSSSKLKKIYNYFNLNLIVGKGSELNKLAKLKRWAVDNLSSKGKNLTSRLYDNLNVIEIVEQ